MRTVTLQDRTLFKARDLLTEIVKQPLGGSERGATTLDHMRLDIRLLDRLAGQGATIDLEEADWTRLCAKVKAFPFAFSDRSVVEFCDDVLNAPEVILGS